MSRLVERSSRSESPSWLPLAASNCAASSASSSSSSSSSSFSSSSSSSFSSSSSLSFDFLSVLSLATESPCSGSSGSSSSSSPILSSASACVRRGVVASSSSSSSSCISESPSCTGGGPGSISPSMSVLGSMGSGGSPPSAYSSFSSSSSTSSCSYVSPLSPSSVSSSCSSSCSSSSSPNPSVSCGIGYGSHFWRQPVMLNDSPGPRAAHSCDVIHGRLYVFAGWNGKRALNDLYVLDPGKLSWLQVRPNRNAPDERNNHTTAVVGLCLFTHGGHDGTKWLQDLHVLDCSAGNEDRYQDLVWGSPVINGSCPSARACHTLSKVGQKLYMFGGYDGSRCFNDIDILDVETLCWIQPKVKGHIPQARNAHTMTVIDSNLLLFGGHSGNKHLTDLHVFDSITLQWSQPDTSGSPPPGLRGHTGNLIGDKIFLFGGYDGKGRSNELYILDTTHLKWVHPAECENAPTGRQRHSASLVGPKQLYIFGGFDGNKWLNDLHVLDIGRLQEDYLTDIAIKNLITNLRGLLNNPELADVILVVEEKDIFAHKTILAASCPYFKTMFAGKMKEAKENRIQILGWSYQAFMTMLEFLYTGRMEYRNSTHVVCEVMGLADHYTMDGLKSMCENVLVHSVDIENVCALLKHADAYQAQELKQYCLQFIFRHAEAVTNTKAFDELATMPSLIMEIARVSLVKQKHTTDKNIR